MPRLIAVDLGSHAVKISTWRVQGRDVSFEERHAMTVPQSGGLPKLEHRLAALDALLDTHPKLAAGPTDRVAFALPGGLATHHRLMLPFTDAAQVEKTLGFALEAEVPFELEDMVVASHTLAVTTQSELLTAVVREDKLGEWIAALAERQLDPEGVFVDSELLGHWAEGAVTGESGGVVVVDVGHTHTAVAVVADGQVKFCRTVSVGGHAFTRAIQRALECEWPEAEARKHGTWDDRGADDEITDAGARSSGYAQLPDPARKAMDGAIGLLLAELRSTLLKAEDSLGIEVEEVRLTGGGSGFRELWDYMAADLGVSIRAVPSAEGEVLPSNWTLAYTAAMRLGAQNQNHAIDLRIGDLTYRGGTDMLRMSVMYGSASIAVFAAAFLAMFAWQYQGLASELADVDDRLAEVIQTTFPTVGESMARGPTRVAIMRESTMLAVSRADMLGDGSGGVPPIVDRLAQLTAAFPPHPDVTVTLSDLTITPTKVEFDAETDGFASSAMVEETLQSNEDFQRAAKGDDVRTSGNRVKFPMNISLTDETLEGQ